MELSERKKLILKAIVDSYVESGEPVGSHTLLGKFIHNCSSATIRNECSDLEKLGLLEKTHTSSGRIPSSKGYRYYVDTLMNSNIGGALEYQIKQSLGERYNNIDVVLKKASQVLSDVTQLVSVVTSEKTTDETLKQINTTILSPQTAVVIIVTSNGNVQNKMFDISLVENPEDFKWCINLLNERLNGTLLNELVNKLELLRPIISTKLKEHETLFQSFVKSFIKMQEVEEFSSGQMNIIKHPELSNPEKINKIISAVKDHSVFKQMFEKNNRDVLIAEETGLDDDVAVFNASYNTHGHRGNISLIGPKRCNYSKIKNTLQSIVDEIENIYKEDDNE